MSNAPSVVQDHKSSVPWVAGLVAAAVLVASGVAYRGAAQRLASVSAGVPLARGTLNQYVPMTIGAWAGTDLPLDEAIIEATDTDDHVKRRYVRSSPRGSVMLFIPYGVRIRDLAPHRPEVCYRVAGWNSIGKESLELTSESGASIPCEIQQFQRGAFGEQRTTVLSYYIIGGTYSADVSLLRSKATSAEDIDYVAQVQIKTPDVSLGTDPEQSVKAFAAESADVIRMALQRAVDDAMSHGKRGPKDTSGTDG